MYAFIADIHLFTNIPKEDHIKSLNKLFELIKSHEEECHGIFVCGDLFDHRGNKDELKFAAQYILMLVCNTCGYGSHLHAPVYFVHGTYSHDNEQYEIFLPLLSQLPDVEIHYIKNVIESRTHAGHSILFLPQEYGDIDYSNYLNKDKHYDLIVGHGPISSEKKEPCKSAGYEIMHSVDLLGNISKLCVFGHYHDYTDFGNGVYYVGANLRWRYGEDEPCVFFTCDNDFNVTTTLNPYAKEFKTIKVSSPEELREHISNKEDCPRRFVINVEDNESLETYHGIINNNKKDKNLSFRITSNIVEDNDELPTITDITDFKKNNSGLDPVQSLITYIKDKYNCDASEQIHEYESKIRKDLDEE